MRAAAEQRAQRRERDDASLRTDLTYERARIAASAVSTWK